VGDFVEEIRIANEAAKLVHDRNELDRMMKLHPRARAVLRRTVEFEYELNIADYTHLTLPEAVERERKMQVSALFRSTDTEVVEDKLEIVWELPDEMNRYRSDPEAAP
jgi:hypothetical protein